MNGLGVERKWNAWTRIWKSLGNAYQNDNKRQGRRVLKGRVERWEEEERVNRRNGKFGAHLVHARRAQIKSSEQCRWQTQLNSTRFEFQTNRKKFSNFESLSPECIFALFLFVYFLSDAVITVAWFIGSNEIFGQAANLCNARCEGTHEWK